MKYVMFDVDGIDVPVIFPEVMQHHQVVVAARFGKAKPVSAGKLSVYPKLDGLGDETDKETVLGFEAYSESISLNLKSRPEDSNIITRYFENF